MSEKNLTPDLEDPTVDQPAEETETSSPATRPPISKAGFDETEPVSEEAAIESTPQPVLSQEPQPTQNGRNGHAPADAASADREALLAVDSYDEAEALLTARPELIESGRIVFGAVVPTVNQNDFADLAIKAVAEDDGLTLKEALRQKRRRGLTLSEPEIDQLLEFADDNLTAEPLLALTVALLLTDDLTRLENAVLWGKQKKIVLTTEKQLNINAMALWDSLSEPDSEPPTPEPEPEPVVAEVAEPEVERVTLTPPPPPRYHRVTRSRQGPPRWLLAGGFIFLLTMMSCGICAVSNWF